MATAKWQKPCAKYPQQLNHQEVFGSFFHCGYCGAQNPNQPEQFPQNCSWTAHCLVSGVPHAEHYEYEACKQCFVKNPRFAKGLTEGRFFQRAMSIEPPQRPCHTPTPARTLAPSLPSVTAQGVQFPPGTTEVPKSASIYSQSAVEAVQRTRSSRFPFPYVTFDSLPKDAEKIRLSGSPRKHGRPTNASSQVLAKRN